MTVTKTKTSPKKSAAKAKKPINKNSIMDDAEFEATHHGKKVVLVVRPLFGSPHAYWLGYAKAQRLAVELIAAARAVMP